MGVPAHPSASRFRHGYPGGKEGCGEGWQTGPFFREDIAIAQIHALPAQVEQSLDLVQRSLDDDKAESIVTISLAGKSSMADYLVIASGRSTRQVGAMADHLAATLKEQGAEQIRVQGVSQGDWVLIDAGDIIVHLFRPEIRAFYNLEKMWGTDMPTDLGLGSYEAA